MLCAQFRSRHVCQVPNGYVGAQHAVPINSRHPTSQPVANGETGQVVLQSDLLRVRRSKLAAQPGC